MQKAYDNWRSLITVAAAAVLFTAVLGVSSATADDGAHHKDLVAAALRANPGAQRISETSILLEPGVVMTLPGPVTPGATMTVPTPDGRQVTVLADTTCATYWVCMWHDTYRGGAKLAFYYCGTYDLGSYYWAAGHNWRDTISSIWNHQVGARAKFTNVIPLAPDWSFYADPGAYYPTLGGWNDIIDKVEPC
jgi:hypothetical protein